MSKNEEEEYFILRLPGDTAAEVHRAISSKKLKDRLKINMCNTEKVRQCRVTLDRIELVGRLTDLPTITEVLKTKDDKVFCKLGDLSQMVVCKHKPKPDATEEEEEVPAQWNHGITPPLKNVRRKRFRKTARKKVKDVVLGEADRLKREVDLLISRDKESRDQSGIEATWVEEFEGGRPDDVAQLSDLEGFGVAAGPAADMSKAGFGDSDDDDDMDDDKVSLSSFATTATGVSVGSLRPSFATTPVPAENAAMVNVESAIPASGGGSGSAAENTPKARPGAIPMGEVDAMQSGPDIASASMDLDSSMPSTMSTPGIFDGGPMVLDTPTGESPNFKPFGGAAQFAGAAQQPANTEPPARAPPPVFNNGNAIADPPRPNADEAVALAAAVELPQPVAAAPAPAPAAAAAPPAATAAVPAPVAPVEMPTPMEVALPATASTAVPAAPIEAPAVEAVVVVDEKLLELDRKIEEQTKKVESQNNPNLKKRFAAQLEKLVKQRAEASGQ